MAKSKTRKNRRLGGHRTIQQLAASRAGKNFARMVCERATEGTEHLLTIELEKGSAATAVSLAGGKLSVANPEVSEFIMTTLATLTTAGITLETFSASGEKYVRCWLVEAGLFHAATAEEARGAAEDTATAGGMMTPDAGVHFRDAFRLTKD